MIVTVTDEEIAALTYEKLVALITERGPYDGGAARFVATVLRGEWDGEPVD